MRAPLPEPPSATSVTQHILRGSLDAAVKADAAYTMPELEIRIQLGPVFIVTKGRAACWSLRELHTQLTPVLDALFPDLHSELEAQIQRRAYLNGIDPPSARLAEPPA